MFSQRAVKAAVLSLRTSHQTFAAMGLDVLFRALNQFFVLSGAPRPRAVVALSEMTVFGFMTYKTHSNF